MLTDLKTIMDREREKGMSANQLTYRVTLEDFTWDAVEETLTSIIEVTRRGPIPHFLSVQGKTKTVIFDNTRHVFPDEMTIFRSKEYPNITLQLRWIPNEK